VAPASTPLRLAAERLRIGRGALVLVLVLVLVVIPKRGTSAAAMRMQPLSLAANAIPQASWSIP